jgi:hypothetical protein
MKHVMRVNVCWAVLLAVIILPTALSGQSRPGGQTSQKVLTNADVANMVRAGLDESTIILAIQRAKTKFDTSPEALIALKKQGVSQGVLNAMLQSYPDSPGAPGVPVAPGVSNRPAANEPEAYGRFYYIGQGNSLVPLEKSRETMAAMGRGVYREVRGDKAGVRLPQGQRPGFVIRGHLSEDFYSLYRFYLKSDRRVIPSEYGSSFPEMEKPIKVKCKVEAYGNGLLKYTPEQDLTPGEYAFAPDSMFGEAFCFGIDGEEAAGGESNNLKGLPVKMGLYYKDAASGWLAIESHAAGKMKTKGMWGAVLSQGITGVQLVEVFPGAQAIVQIPERRPTFYLRTSYLGAENTQRMIKEIIIVRFDKKKNSREVETVSGGGMTGTRVGFKKSAIRECTVSQIGDDLLSVTPDTDLEPGEYLLTTNRFDKYDFGISGAK